MSDISETTRQIEKVEESEGAEDAAMEEEDDDDDLNEALFGEDGDSGEVGLEGMYSEQVYHCTAAFLPAQELGVYSRADS